MAGTVVMALVPFNTKVPQAYIDAVDGHVAERTKQLLQIPKHDRPTRNPSRSSVARQALREYFEKYGIPIPVDADEEDDEEG